MLYIIKRYFVHVATWSLHLCWL